MKICLKCNIPRESFGFNKDKNRPDGRFPYCRECVKKLQKMRYESNRESVLSVQKKYYQENKILILKRQSEYNKKNKKNKQQYDKLYKQRNKAKRKLYLQANRYKKAEYDKKYRDKQDKQRRRRYHANYMENRRQSDALFNLTCNLRSRINKFFAKKNKSKKTIELLGCSFEQVFAHLESLFQPGMTWNNYGKWHVDHIVPLVSAKTIEEAEKLCNYNNLQPLWAIDNLTKSKK
jgi:hypothetical protein